MTGDGVGRYDDGERFAAGDARLDPARVAALQELGRVLEQIADRNDRRRAIRAWQAAYDELAGA